MFEERKIIGTLLRADGVPERGANIVFTPITVIGSGGSGGAVLSTAPVTVTTSVVGIGSGGGGFTALLLTVTGGAVRYSCKLPCGNLFLFNLVPGDQTLAFDELLNQNQT